MRLRARHAINAPKPREMIIDLCATCNAQCPFCPRISMPEERSKGVIADHVLDRCIAEAKQHGIKEIRLYSTAEPTMHPKFDEIVARLKREGFTVGCSTNASTLMHRKEGLALVDTLQYSIEGWDQASYEKFRYPLKFDKVRNNITAFWDFVQGKAVRPAISVNLLLTRSTNIEAFAACWGPYVDKITIGFLMGTTVWKNGEFVNDQNPEIGDDYFDHDVSESGVCGYPFEVATVSYDGKISLCCEDFTAELPLGNITDGLDQLAKNETMKQIRNQFYSGRLDMCRGCNLFRHPRAADVAAARARIEALPADVKRKLVLQA